MELEPREWKCDNFRTPGGGMALERLASMSPAAQHLATTRLGIRLGTDKALRASYTPSPQRQLSGTPTPSPQRLTRKGQDHTPTIDRSLTSTPGHAESRELTDNLLHLPKRAKASDFFWSLCLKWKMYVYESGGMNLSHILCIIVHIFFIFIKVLHHPEVGSKHFHLVHLFWLDILSGQY